MKVMCAFFVKRKFAVIPIWVDVSTGETGINLHSGSTRENPHKYVLGEGILKPVP